MDYLSILGLVKGESEYTYPPYSDVQARELIDGLRNIAPYVVIDCGSYIANDILSAVRCWNLTLSSLLQMQTEIYQLSVQPAPTSEGCWLGLGQTV